MAFAIYIYPNLQQDPAVNTMSTRNIKSLLRNAWWHSTNGKNVGHGVSEPGLATHGWRRSECSHSHEKALASEPHDRETIGTAPIILPWPMLRADRLLSLLLITLFLPPIIPCHHSLARQDQYRFLCYATQPTSHKSSLHTFKQTHSTRFSTTQARIRKPSSQRLNVTAKHNFQ